MVLQSGLGGVAWLWHANSVSGRGTEGEDLVESQSVMDLTAALDRLDGDEELFLTLAGLFVERSPEALVAIQTAMTAGDIPTLIKEATTSILTNWIACSWISRTRGFC